jgi:hypothetical protein
MIRWLATETTMRESLCSVDWVAVAKVVQTLLTPAIAILVVVITSRIQRQQVKTQRQQYRFALMERRMKVYDATSEFIAHVIQEAKVGTREPLFKLIRETREHHMLFGAEIGTYIDELYIKGTRLHSMWLAAGVEHVIRPEDIQEEVQIQQWFTGQLDAVKKMFLKYLDFREP